MIVSLIVLGVLGCIPAVWNESIPFVPFLSGIQFPWRFIGPILFICCVLGAIAFRRFTHSSLTSAVPVVSLVVIILTFAEGGSTLGSAQYNLPTQASVSSSDESLERITGSIMGGEYLPQEAQYQTVLDLASSLNPGEPYRGDGFEMTHEASGGRVFNVSFDGSKNEVSLPLLSYPGYEIVSNAEGSSIDADTNGLILLKVPHGFSGTVSVKFVPPAHWRLYEVVSLVTAIGLVGGVCCCLMRSHRDTGMGGAARRARRR